MSLRVKLKLITNFAELVELVAACGASDLQRFLHSEVRKNAKYTSTTAVSDFIAAIAQWVEGGLLRSLKQSPYFTLLGDECTDVHSCQPCNTLLQDKHYYFAGF